MTGLISIVFVGRLKVVENTLERWYAAARKDSRQSEILQPKLRIDRGEQRSLKEELKSCLSDFQLKYPFWSIQLIHAQWFVNETAEVLVHGFIQAILKRRFFIPTMVLP